MSNEKKTLADVQPGGRVRLGDGLPPLPPKDIVDTHLPTGVRIYGYTAEQMREYARATLSARPSPGGQGGLNYERMFVDACAALAEVSRELGCDPEQGGAEPILAAISELREALAARQPVGEPVRYFDPDVLAHLTEGLIDPVGVLRRKPNGTSNVPVWLGPPAQAVDLAPRPMATAPHDGTMVRLLVQFKENATEDTSEPTWTIGACNDDNVGEDERIGWQFAGWCWTHDHFTEGKGTPVGWLPMIDSAQAVDLGQSIPSELAPVAAALKRFGDCAEDSGSEGCDIGRDWFDALTTIGLLSRTQRSPAVWTMTAEGERLLALIDSHGASNG